MPRQIEGIIITKNSFHRTEIPHELKNLEILIGLTSIKRHGKKYRYPSKGLKKPIPLPPLVIASKTPCDAVHKKR